MSVRLCLQTPESVKTILDLKGSLRLKVASDSMNPVIKVDDLILLESLKDIKTLNRFDVIVYAKDQNLICHYFWCLNSLQTPPTISTRSLKEPFQNELPFTADKILGIVRSHRIGFIRRATLIFLNLLRSSL